MDARVELARRRHRDSRSAGTAAIGCSAFRAESSWPVCPAPMMSMRRESAPDHGARARTRVRIFTTVIPGNINAPAISTTESGRSRSRTQKLIPKMIDRDQKHGPEEVKHIAEASVGPDGPVNAENEVADDVAGGEEYEDCGDEFGVFARDIAIEAQHECRGIGERDHGKVENHGAKHVHRVTREHTGQQRRDGSGFRRCGQRAPLPLRTTDNARRRMLRSLTIDRWSTYCRSYLTDSA